MTRVKHNGSDNSCSLRCISREWTTLECDRAAHIPQDVLYGTAQSFVVLCAVPHRIVPHRIASHSSATTTELLALLDWRTSFHERTKPNPHRSHLVAAMRCDAMPPDPSRLVLSPHNHSGPICMARCVRHASAVSKPQPQPHPIGCALSPHKHWSFLRSVNPLG